MANDQLVGRWTGPIAGPQPKRGRNNPRRAADSSSYSPGSHRAGDSTALKPSTGVRLEPQALDKSKLPSHVFFLGSLNDGDALTLGEFFDRGEEQGIELDGNLAGHVQTLAYLLGEVGTPFTETHRELTGSEPLDLKVEPNPPLILVNPFLFSGSQSKTAKENQGIDVRAKLNELCERFGLNERQKPRLISVRPNERELLPGDRIVKYSAELQPYYARSDIDGIGMVTPEDFTAIMQAYAASL
ncbi:MAG: hypothetical protein OXU45_05640 [Candidatus Melainabacteria bacterium]|nr:hypothetical protein [Candidatus Melainabacteria bacterium]